MKIDIRQFGAMGDGLHPDTGAFQKACQAIRDCPDTHSVLNVPPGIYLSGTIRLPSNTTLFLEAGATLLASRNPEDFQANPFIFPDKATSPKGSYDWLSRFFVGAMNAENVIIDGDGSINCSGDAFWEDVCFDGMPPAPNDPERPVHYRVFKPRPKRPVTVAFWKCANVIVRNIRLDNAAAYTVWPQGCKNVRLQNLTIRSSYNGPNTDALDIDCSENVIISGCDIAAGDDCIALKSDTSRMGEDLPCRNVVVSNCIFSSTACGVRLGYEGDGPITDCSFSNLVIYDTKNALDFLSLTPSPRPDYNHGTDIERIQFSNISIRNVSHAIHLWAGTENTANPYQAHIRDLSFSDINAVTRNGSFLGARDGAPVLNLSMRDIRIHMDLHPYYNGISPLPYPNLWGGDFLPDVMLLHRIQNLRMDGVELTTNNPAGQLLRWNQCRNFRYDHALLPEEGILPRPE